MNRGHIKKRGKNSYSVIITIPGTEKRKWYTVKGIKKDAEKFLTEKLRELDTGTLIDSKNLTIKDYMNYWYEEHCLNKLSPTTYESYRRNLDAYIIPKLGHIKIDQLLPLHLQTFYKNCSEKGLSNTTVIYIHRILHCALKQAMKWQLVIRNVADCVELPKKEKYQATVLDTYSLERLLKDIENTYIYLPVIIAISTGMRRGEILGLTWENVDLILGNIKVVQALYPTKEGLRILPPKTQKSKRTISIPPTLIKVLKEYRLKHETMKLKLGPEYDKHNYVCCNENGTPLCPTKLNHFFKDLLKNNELPAIRFHDLRHSHASLLLSQGVQPKVISDRLGHSTINITMDLYSHIYDATNREVANNFDIFLKRA